MAVFANNIDFNAVNSPSPNMPAKKRVSKAAQAQAHSQSQLIVSDYDTDTANYTDNNIVNAIPPPPPERSNAELNKLVLQRWVPDLHSIIAIAPFAVLYTFSPESGQWDKCDTQGSLFVLQLATTPYPSYQVFILNRKNPENLRLDLVSTDHIEVTDEFIIITERNEETETVQVHGIWMYSDGDIPAESSREAIAQIITECAQKAEQYAHDFGSQDEGVYDEAEKQNGHHEEPQVYPPDPQTFQSAQQEQKLDLATLFGRPQQQQDPPPQHAAPFSSTPETEFFRGSQSPAHQEQQRSGGIHATHSIISQPSTQQNALLDLFKNAKRE